jgi:hypothetical protein
VLNESSNDKVGKPRVSGNSKETQLGLVSLEEGIRVVIYATIVAHHTAMSI